MGFRRANGGFEEWRYPYHRILIDEKQGEVIGLWHQVSPALREDGTHYEVAGIGGSWFRYGGNYKWEWQRDFFDLGNVKALFFELAADGKLDPAVKRKIGKLPKGNYCLVTSVCANSQVYGKNSKVFWQ